MTSVIKKREGEMNEVNLSKRDEFLSICKRIITDPRKFWEDEPTGEEDVFHLYKRFGFLIVGMPIIFGLLGYALAGKLNSVVLNSSLVGFTLSVCVSYVMSWIMHWLSPKFGGARNLTGALKLNLYSQVPAAIMAIASLLGVGVIGYILQLVGGIWSIIITYLGVPKMLSVPRENLVPFILTTWAVMVILTMILGSIVSQQV